MPYPSGHAQKTRVRIVQSARRLFNRSGFENVSINQIMADANLTRGAFYKYFDSKSDLNAEVMNCFFTDPNWSSSWEGVQVNLAAKNVGAQIVSAYLSRQHFENIEESCPMVALPTDIARSGASAKRAFENVFKGMVRALELGLPGTNGDRRTTAQAIAALCVGGMVIARAMGNRKMADDLCNASLSVALKLGRWKRVNGNKPVPSQSQIEKEINPESLRGSRMGDSLRCFVFLTLPKRQPEGV
jgi:TetR/AcrR family transcriptional regulator, transcriptional repressor for nem operon